MVVQSAIGPPVEEARGSAEAFRAGATQPSPSCSQHSRTQCGYAREGGIKNVSPRTTQLCHRSDLDEGEIGRLHSSKDLVDENCRAPVARDPGPFGIRHWPRLH